MRLLLAEFVCWLRNLLSVRRRPPHAWALVWMAVTVVAPGCSSGLEEFPVAAVKGRVLCDGKPVPHVNVYFEPLRTGDSAVTGKPGFAVADDKGEFVLTTYHEGDGAVIGRHRVRVEGPRGAHAAGFQCECVLSDTVDVMEVEVTKDQEHNFEVALQKNQAGQQVISDREREEREGI
jgi:hypothetical protein